MFMVAPDLANHVMFAKKTLRRFTFQRSTVTSGRMVILVKTQSYTQTSLQKISSVQTAAFSKRLIDTLFKSL